MKILWRHHWYSLSLVVSLRVEITIQHINNTSDTGRQNNDLLHSRSGFTEDFLCAAQQQTDTGNVAWDEINPGIYQLLEISFIGRRKNRSFEYDTRRVLMFISVLSLRMEGGRERGRRGRREGGRERRIVPLTGLALCVMNGAVTDGDRFVFNTCGCTIRSASPDKPGAFLSRWSPNRFISGCLWRIQSLRGVAALRPSGSKNAKILDGFGSD